MVTLRRQRMYAISISFRLRVAIVNTPGAMMLPVVFLGFVVLHLLHRVVSGTRVNL